MALFSQAPASLCILRLSSIGDVCNALAAVQSIQRHWPDTLITWIIGKTEAQLLEGINNIELIIYDKSSGLSGILNIWRQLAHRQFDALLHMQLALRASLLTLGIRARYKVGFHRGKAREGQWLFTNKRLNDTACWHVVDNFLAFASYLGVPDGKARWNLELDAAEHDFARRILNGKPTVVIAPAASHTERAWATDRYAAFADHVAGKAFQVALCGSSTRHERELANAIISQMKHPALDLVGRTTLRQLAAVLAQSCLLLAPDSGPAHLASSQDTPVISLHAHSDPRRTGPYHSLASVISQYEPLIFRQYGRPARLLPWGTRAHGKNLMNHIELAPVIAQFDDMATEGAQ